MADWDSHAAAEAKNPTPFNEQAIPPAGFVSGNPEMLKSGGGALSAGGESTVALDKDATDWINKKMRPMMGWIYMLTCITDFIIFPVLWSILQAAMKQPITPWQPITLQGAGLFHLSMGAIIGVAAFGRTQEKLAGAQNGGATTTTTRFTPGLTTTGVFQATRVQSPTIPSGFNGTSASDFNQPQVRAGFGGKLAPEQPLYPQL